MDHDRRRTDHWHILEIAVPAGAFFLLATGFAFALAIINTNEEQGRLRREQGTLMQKIVDACRKPLQ